MRSCRPLLIGITFDLLPAALCSPIRHYRREDGCVKAKVAILGAGVAGITAAQTLSENGVDDFVIVEYQDRIGGRLLPHEFGSDSNSEPYTVELGANWVHGTSTDEGPVNPIFILAQKYNLTYAFSDFEVTNNLFYNQSGFISPFDWILKSMEFEDAFESVEYDAGSILSGNLPDKSLRSALKIAGWDPKGDPMRMLLEWNAIDYDLAQSPDVTSELFGVVNFNTTFLDFSGDNLFITDPRGFQTFIQGEAATFLEHNDTRLILNAPVYRISTDLGTANFSVLIQADQGQCIEADYAITTFSVGVLQSGDIEFNPPLPQWKTDAIATMQMGIYTKIFLQFPPDKVFWDKTVQFSYYAAATRGVYPAWQNLDFEGFHPGSGILFVTVVGDESRRIEKQSDQITLREIMFVLYLMFPGKDIPAPLDFFYPRWSDNGWSYGSYSNVPIGMTLQSHQNLRANVGPIWFAGEATSTQYFGFLQGAYYEGLDIGQRVSRIIKGENCTDMVHYEDLKGTTNTDQYSEENGWRVNTLARRHPAMRGRRMKRGAKLWQ